MSKFTITINPFKAPFMREKMKQVPTVCKYRDGHTYRYSEYAYGKPHCGRVYRWEDTQESADEKAQYVEGFMKRVQRAYDKAVSRFHKYYAGIDYNEEIVKTYAPYPQVPSATISVMSARWRQYQEDKKALSQFVSRMRIQFGHMMSSAQQGEYKRIGDSLYLIHKYNLAIQSMCRPDHHEVVYKQVRGVDPMLANRR